MKSTTMLIFLTMLHTFAVSQESKNIIVKGTVKDLKTKMPLVAQITIIYADTQLETDRTTTKADGSFEIKTLPKQLVLQAKSANYIVSNIVMNLEKLRVPTVISEIPLVFNGKSKINQVLLEFASQKNEQEQDKDIPKNKQVFQAIDALDSKAIAAQFRLTGSYKNSNIIKTTSKDTSVFEYNFTEREHLMVEVLSEGYQKFLSEIDIETFNKTVHENTAKLIKKVAFLNLIAQNESKTPIITVSELSENTQKQVSLTANGSIHFGMLTPGNKYKITIDPKISETITTEFVAIEGINQHLVLLEPKQEKSEVLTATKNQFEAETKVVQLEKQAFKTENKSNIWGIETIFFDQSSTALKQESKAILEQISKKMVESPAIKIAITGHTDNTGDARQNLYLSEFRAKVIASFLFNKGIKSDRVLLKGNGSQAPNTGNDTEENRQKNRRAELRFYNQ